MKAETQMEFNRNKTLSEHALNNCIHLAQITEGCKRTLTAMNYQGHIQTVALSLPDVGMGSLWMSPKDRIQNAIEAIICAWPRGLFRFTLILPDTSTADLTYKIIDKLEEQETARLKAARRNETKKADGEADGE